MKRRSSIATGAGASFGCVFGVILAFLAICLFIVIMVVGMGSCAIVAGS